jgi:hypothetical protein
MILTSDEKNIMINILRTLTYNKFNDLKNNILENKNKLSKDKYSILLFGNKESKNNQNCKIITHLDNRWCLQSILYYHVHRTKKITQDQYIEILSIK